MCRCVCVCVISVTPPDTPQHKPSISSRFRKQQQGSEQVRAFLGRTRPERDSGLGPVCVAAPLSQKHLRLLSTCSVAGVLDCRAECQAPEGSPGGAPDPSAPRVLVLESLRETQGVKHSPEPAFTERERQGRASHYSVPWSLRDSGLAARGPQAPLLDDSRRTPPLESERQQAGAVPESPRHTPHAEADRKSLLEPEVRQEIPTGGDEPGSGCVGSSPLGEEVMREPDFLRTWQSGARHLRARGCLSPHGATESEVSFPFYLSKCK